jgi:hypothetical protein
MTERPRPDLNKVRDAMRAHDEREEEDEQETTEPEPGEDDDGDT